jgi:hypothetical protein
MCETAATYNLKRQQKQQTSQRLALEHNAEPVVGKVPPKELGKQIPNCNTCGKLHMGDCRKGSLNCFKCGKPDNFLKNCPMNPTKETRTQGIGLQQ